MEEYEKGKEVGRGTFGAVFAGTRRRDGALVAIKRIHTTAGEGVDFTALREILALGQCQCENILGLIDVFVVKASDKEKEKEAVLTFDDRTR